MKKIATDEQVEKIQNILVMIYLLILCIGTPLFRNIMDTYNNNTVGSWVLSFFLMVVIVGAIGRLFIKYEKVDDNDLSLLQEFAKKHEICKLYIDSLNSINRKHIYKLDIEACKHLAKNESIAIILGNEQSPP